MQTWIFGDSSTAGNVRHWTGTSKDMLGMVRIDGKSYRFLGSCYQSPVDPRCDVDVPALTTRSVAVAPTRTTF